MHNESIMSRHANLALRSCHLLARALALTGLLVPLASCNQGDVLREGFDTTPFSRDAPRWCERYHHAHFEDGSIRFLRSSATEAACTSAGGHALSCTMPGCDPCGCVPPCSPCAKSGDANGNAVLMTTTDAPGTRRVATATFTIERQMPVGSHIGLYVALHPHCHTTVQGLLVADGSGTFHLNVAAFNQYIGGDRSIYRSCLEHPFAEISPPLVGGIALAEGRRYRWRLAAHLAPDGQLHVSSFLPTAGTGRRLTGRYIFVAPFADRWFGAAGQAARYAFGAQFSRAGSPSGGEPSLRLLQFIARP